MGQWILNTRSICTPKIPAIRNGIPVLHNDHNGNRSKDIEVEVFRQMTMEAGELDDLQDFGRSHSALLEASVDFCLKT